MPGKARRHALHLLLALFLTLSAGSALAMFMGMILTGVLLLVSALVFLAGLVILLLLPLITQFFD